MLCVQLQSSLDSLLVKTVGQALAFNYDLEAINGGNFGGVIIESHDGLYLCRKWILTMESSLGCGIFVITTPDEVEYSGITLGSQPYHRYRSLPQVLLGDGPRSAADS